MMQIDFDSLPLALAKTPTPDTCNSEPYTLNRLPRAKGARSPLKASIKQCSHPKRTTTQHLQNLYSSPENEFCIATLIPESPPSPPQAPATWSDLYLQGDRVDRSSVDYGVQAFSVSGTRI